MVTITTAITIISLITWIVRKQRLADGQSLLFFICAYSELYSHWSLLMMTPYTDAWIYTFRGSTKGKCMARPSSLSSYKGGQREWAELLSSLWKPPVKSSLCCPHTKLVHSWNFLCTQELLHQPLIRPPSVSCSKAWQLLQKIEIF